MPINRPMLAAKVDDFTKLRYPLIATTKLDGIRCLVINEKVLSRSFKPIRNHYITSLLRNLPSGLDGEIVAGNFQQTSSAVMSFDGEPHFIYKVFDFVPDGIISTPYEKRLALLKQLVLAMPDYVEYVQETVITNQDELFELLARMRRAEQEGICLRKPTGFYKCGRSTFNEQGLLKIKFMEDSEAVIVGFEEAMENQNPQLENEVGLSHRGHSREFMVPKGTTGKIIGRDLTSGQTIVVGTGIGFNDTLKLDMWLHQEKYLGLAFKYQYQQVGTKDSPRIPSFQGFRFTDDMD